MTTKTITFDNVEYPVTDFSPEVQQSVEIFALWEQELTGKRLEMMRYELALDALRTRISETVRQELAGKEAEATQALPAE